MATFFGEVVEPNSRSFLTDGEESFISKRYAVETRGVSNIKKNGCYEYMVIACGTVLFEFSEAYLSSSRKILEVFDITPMSEEKPLTKGISSCTLYTLSGNKLLLVCEKIPHVYLAQSILGKIRPWIELSNHIVVLTSENMINFQPRGSLTPFNRSLHTKDCTMTIEAPNLELPNTISGLPAAVLSWCQANKKSAALYITYVESSHLDSITAEPILQLLKKFSYLRSSILSDSAKLKKIVSSSSIPHSNLYL